MKNIHTTIEQQEILKRARIDINESQPSTIFMGNFGSGKTEILRMIADKYNTTLYTDSMISAIYEKEGQFGINRLVETPVLILDDIEGDVKSTSYGSKSRELIDQIIFMKLEKMASMNSEYAKIVSHIEFLNDQRSKSQSPYTDEEFQVIMNSRESARKNWENAIENGSKLFVSTNLTSKDFKIRFEGKTYDRIKAHLKVITMTTASSMRSINK